MFHQKKILVADDEQGIINFVKVYLQKKGYLVYTANTGRETLELLQIEPDMILLDIMMPDMDGIEVCKMIRDQVDCPILFLTAKTDEADRILGLTVGGDDYILKPFSIEELGARVEAHFRREARSGQKHHLRYFGDLWIDYQKHDLGYGKDRIDLTPKEYDIVKYLSDNRGLIFSQEQIYEKIWGYDAEGDARTAVTEHVKRIRRKLEKEACNPIETVWGVGYKWSL